MEETIEQFDFNAMPVPSPVPVPIPVKEETSIPKPKPVPALSEGKTNVVTAPVPAVSTIIPGIATLQRPFRLRFGLRNKM